MMDPLKFIVGVVVTAAGIIGTVFGVPGAQFLIPLGAQMQFSAVFGPRGLSDRHEGAQVGHSSPAAALPIVYGTTRFGGEF